MAYTVEEEKELNKQLRRWKKRQLTAVRQINIDGAFEKMSEAERATWEQIARAESYKEVSNGAWMFAECVIDKYCKLARETEI